MVDRRSEIPCNECLGLGYMNGFMVKVGKYSIHSVHLGIDWSHDNPQDSFWSVKGIQTSHSNPSWEFVKIYENLPSLANSKSTWKLMIGRRFFPFGFRPIFTGEVLVLRRVYFFQNLNWGNFLGWIHEPFCLRMISHDFKVMEACANNGFKRVLLELGGAPIWTREFWAPQNVAFWKWEPLLFQGNLGWWNIIPFDQLL